MCGILGGINIKWKSNPIQSLKHRGPDFYSTYKNKNVFLGHTRLSILDTSNLGNQPMLSEDKKWVIVFNGEIYNHLKIRKDLEDNYKETFISKCDTETLLKGWIHYKEEILNKLNGIYSFAIFNIVENKITIVRDPFGIKPLYIYKKNKELAFSSEIKSFLNIKDFDNYLDFDGIINYLNFLWSPGEKTMYTNVEKLLPGYLININIKNFTTNKKLYYNNNFTKKYNFNSEKEWVDNLDQKISKAVKRQLISDVPIGFFLSGGLDSSLLVAIAKKILPDKKLNCFTIDTNTSEGREGFEDDLPYARKVAKHLNVNLHEIKVNNNFLPDFDKMIYFLDEPQADLAPLNVKFISKKAKKIGIKVLIGGTGGDDLFTGYRRHQAILFEKNINRIPIFFLKFIKVILYFLPSKIPLFRRIKRLSRDWGQTQQNRLFGYFNWLPNNNFHNDLLIKNRKYDIYNYFRKIINQNLNSSLLNKMLLLEQKTFLVDHNLNYTDKMSMSEGVEVRVPYLDIDLVKFSQNIPDNLKLNKKVSKYILKKVAERYLPMEVIYRSKTGFGAPIRNMLNDELKPLIKKYLNRDKIIRQNIFKYEKIESILKDHSLGKNDFAYNILSLLSIQSWLNKFSWKSKK